MGSFSQSQTGGRQLRRAGCNAEFNEQAARNLQRELFRLVRVDLQLILSRGSAREDRDPHDLDGERLTEARLEPVVNPDRRRAAQ